MDSFYTTEGAYHVLWIHYGMENIAKVLDTHRAQNTINISEENCEYER